MRSAGATRPGPVAMLSSRRVRPRIQSGASSCRRRHWPWRGLRRTRRRHRNLPRPPSRVTAEPVDDLLHPAGFLALGLGAQGGVGGEEDPFLEGDRRALAKARQRDHVGAVAADCRPVALGGLDQFIGLRDPQSAAAAFEPVVENDGGDLAALAGAGAVAEKPAAPETYSALGAFRGGRNNIVVSSTA